MVLARMQHLQLGQSWQVPHELHWQWPPVVAQLPWLSGSQLQTGVSLQVGSTSKNFTRSHLLPLRAFHPWFESWATVVHAPLLVPV